MLWQALKDSVWRRACVDRVAVVADGLQVTYGELLNSAEALAARLSEQGVVPGHVVLTCLDNEPAFLVALLASARLGATFAPLDVGSTEAEGAQLLTLTGADVVICAPSQLQRWAPRVGLALALSPDGAVSGGHASRTPLTSVDGAAGCIQFSSGTTGEPKGILLSHAAFLYRSRFLMEALGLGPEDRTLCALPLSHTHGAECLALPTLLAGGTLHLLSPGFAYPLYVLQELAVRRITFFSTIPQFYDFAVKLQSDQCPDLRALRLPFCGSAALSRATAEAFAARYGVQIRQGYGLAELSVICVNFQPAEELAFDSVGRPIEGIEWKIDGGGLEGELWVRSDAQFTGYLNDPAGTAQRLTEDGWLRTGDIVSVDADGLFRIVGRREDFIKVRGFKVYASEVETAAVGVPWVRECAVVGERDDVGAESIVAHVVLDEHAPPASALERALTEALRPVLSQHKLPRRCVPWPALPKSPMGKVLKSRIGAD